MSYLNDFIFCPRSIYFHQLHGERSTRLYQARPQIEGKAVHGTLDGKRYSTRADVLQAIDVYSTKYKLCGKIDQFESKRGVLTERKKKIKQVYDGYILQLYAQYFALTEMQYVVNSLRLYSFDDNKIYPVDLPAENAEMLSLFEKTVVALHTFDLEMFTQTNADKCKSCIYNTICDQSLC
jgi:CRISPR-associated protein Cas4